MRNHLQIQFWLSLIFLVALWAMSIHTLFQSQVLGVSDNGDFIRITQPAGLAKFNNKVMREPVVTELYEKSPIRPELLTSIATIPVFVVKEIHSLIYGQESLFPVSFLGHLLALCWLCIILAAFCLWRTGLPYIIVSCCILADPAYCLYFNSFLTEGFVILSLLSVVMHLLGGSKASESSLIIIPSVIINLSKPHFTWIAGTFYSIARGRIRARVGLLAVLYVAPLAYLLFLSAGAGKESYAANRYNSVFQGALKLSSTPEKILTRFELPEEYISYIGKEYWKLHDAEQAAINDSLERIGPVTIATLYLQDLELLKNALFRVGGGFFASRLDSIGNFSDSNRPNERYVGFLSFHEKVEDFIYGSPALGCLVIVCVLLCGLKFGSVKEKRIIAALLCVGVLVNVTALVGDGLSSYGRHTLISRLCLDLALGFSICSVMLLGTRKSIRGNEVN